MKTKAVSEIFPKQLKWPLYTKNETSFVALLIDIHVIETAFTVVMFVGCMVIARGAQSSKAQPGFKISQKTPHCLEVAKEDQPRPIFQFYLEQV